MRKNSLKKIRESLMMSKAELARKANISPITITRIESGVPCRMETKRKIILALGLKISDKNKVFGEDMELSIKNKEDRRSGIDRRKF
jgi:DNA-binding XRE family transcriptional regulator